MVIILTKFGTTRKMLNASFLQSCGGCFFNFQRTLEDFCEFCDVDMCNTVIIAGESTDFDKNALIVFIHRLNVHLCSISKCYFKST